MGPFHLVMARPALAATLPGHPLLADLQGDWEVVCKLGWEEQLGLALDGRAWDATQLNHM